MGERREARGERKGALISIGRQAARGDAGDEIGFWEIKLLSFGCEFPVFQVVHIW